jgi:hypothetical protein
LVSRCSWADEHRVYFPLEPKSVQTGRAFSELFPSDLASLANLRSLPPWHFFSEKRPPILINFLE